MSDYKKLQNGSDIRGIAIGGVAGETPNLTPKEAKHIAAGFTKWLQDKTGIEAVTVAVGRDPRVSGLDLLKGLLQGFCKGGVQVFDAGLASTPAMFMATIFEDVKDDGACDGAIMITASHLPFNRNGFKFFTKDGGLDKKDIAKILELAADHAAKAESADAASGTEHGEAAKLDNAAESLALMDAYCKHLRQLIKDGVSGGSTGASAEKTAGAPDEAGEKVADNPLAGMKIVVDAGNGSAGFFAEKVLEPLGADVSGSQFLEPDGMFPNHAPNPENKAAMEAISAQVLRTGADLGLIFDTDVDRSAAVDEQGREVARNGIVAMAAALVAEDHPGTTVVTDSITSRQLTEFLEGDLGLKHLRYRRGYKNVINKAIELNQAGTDCQLAIETSGHAALQENYFLDDGAYLAVKIVIKAARLKKEGKPISSVLAGLEDPADEKEVRIPIQTEEFGAYGDQVLEELKAWVVSQDGMALTEPNYEGVRIDFGDGWCLLRKSLHDPILPMNMASDQEGGCQAIARTMKEFLTRYESLGLEGVL